MKYSRSILAATLMAFATFQTQAADKAAVDTHVNSYLAAGKAIVEMSITKKVDASEVEKKASLTAGIRQEEFANPPF